MCLKPTLTVSNSSCQVFYYMWPLSFPPQGHMISLSVHDYPKICGFVANLRMRTSWHCYVYSLLRPPLPQTTTNRAKQQQPKQTVSCQPSAISLCQLTPPAQFTRNALHCDFAIAYEFLWVLYAICRSFAFFVPTFLCRLWCPFVCLAMSIFWYRCMWLWLWLWLLRFVAYTSFMLNRICACIWVCVSGTMLVTTTALSIFRLSKHPADDISHRFNA